MVNNATKYLALKLTYLEFCQNFLLIPILAYPISLGEKTFAF